MMHINGSCHCGEITFEAEVDENKVKICHCNDCQKLSGTAFRSVAVSEPNSFIFTKGKTKEYVKVAENGNQRAQGFCQHCGSAIYATSVDTLNRVYGIRVGCIEQRDLLVPKSQIWCRSAVPWINEIATIPAFDTVPDQ
ncbi:GFA family protein [Colwellia sp. PAMC 21821]|uniref:GFA family protein n=1 Tax=Colwellia sp. PAMC 21821 TaxID=1816219 RepID=UPI00268CDBD9